MTEIKLSDHFTYRKLFRFTLPSILMMIFTSIYSMVDGFFVSNYTGKTAFAAINLIYPYIGILGAFGFMIGTGGAAVVGRMLGQQQREEANRTFSMFVWTAVISGIVFTIVGVATVRPIALLLGATPDMLEDCVLYGSIVLCGTPFSCCSSCSRYSSPPPKNRSSDWWTRSRQAARIWCSTGCLSAYSGLSL